MMLAAIGDTGYNIALLVHVITAFAAFAPAFVMPFLDRQLDADDGSLRVRLFQAALRNSRTIYGPALIVTGLAGFGVAGLSDGVYKMSQGWLVTAIVVWIVMNGVLHAVLVPAERAVGAGDRSAEGRVAAAGALLTGLLVVMLIIMIWKPGV